MLTCELINYLFFYTLDLFFISSTQRKPLCTSNTSLFQSLTTKCCYLSLPFTRFPSGILEVNVSYTSLLRSDAQRICIHQNATWGTCAHSLPISGFSSRGQLFSSWSVSRNGGCQSVYSILSLESSSTSPRQQRSRSFIYQISTTQQMNFLF